MKLARARKAKKTHVEAVAALIRNEKDGSYFITQRHLDDFLGGLWEFPGGKRRKGESFEQALKREVKEETDLIVEVGSRHKALSFEYPDRVVALYFYWARILKGKPKAIGCRDFKWVQPAELLNFTFPPADSELILELSKPTELFCN